MFLSIRNRLIIKLPFYSQFLDKHFGLCQFKTKLPLREKAGFGFRFLNHRHQHIAEKVVKTSTYFLVARYLLKRFKR